MKFTTKTRQRIIDDYLAETGRNMFIPSEFIDWLGGQPDHEAFPWFYGKDDAEAAREYRIGLARRMASGLRIVVKAEESASNVIAVTTREYPAYVSPIAGRRSGGGYEPFDPSDAPALAELQRQGASSLRAWIARYRGAAVAMGLDMQPVEEIALALDGRVAEAG